MVPAARFPPGGQRAGRTGNRCSASVGERFRTAAAFRSAVRLIPATTGDSSAPASEPASIRATTSHASRESRIRRIAIAVGPPAFTLPADGLQPRRSARAIHGIVEQKPGSKPCPSRSNSVQVLAVGGTRVRFPSPRSGFFRIHLAAGADSYLARGCGTKSCSDFNAPASMNRR